MGKIESFELKSNISCMYFSFSFRFGNRENRLFHISPSLAAIERPSISSMDGGRNMIYRPTSVVGSIVST